LIGAIGKHHADTLSVIDYRFARSRSATTSCCQVVNELSVW
jgi:hypothetical protein